MGPATQPPVDDKGPAMAKGKKGGGRSSTGGPIGGPADGKGDGKSKKGDGKKRKREPKGGLNRWPTRCQLWNEWDPIV